MEFKVSDTGIGIPDKEVPNLFKMFSTASQHRNRYNWRGTGIGLTISKKLVESLGGRISITSQVDVGTIATFTVKDRTIYNPLIEESKKLEYLDSPQIDLPIQSSCIQLLSYRLISLIFNILLKLDL